MKHFAPTGMSVFGTSQADLKVEAMIAPLPVLRPVVVAFSMIVLVWKR